MGLVALVAIGGGGETIVARAEVVGDRAVGGEEPLRRYCQGNRLAAREAGCAILGA